MRHPVVQVLVLLAVVAGVGGAVYLVMDGLGAEVSVAFFLALVVGFLAFVLTSVLLWPGLLRFRRRDR